MYVEDGWPLMAVVPIHDIWIIANFKETQVENIQVGQKVSITFDAFFIANVLKKIFPKSFLKNNVSEKRFLD